MSKHIYDFFDPTAAISAEFRPSYEFSHVARYGNDVPHSVIFMDELGDLLKVPVSRFEMGDYKEWQDSEILPSREVGRAAAALCLIR